MSLAFARLFARLRARARPARLVLPSPLAEARLLARLRLLARVAAPIATLLAIALVETAGRRWEMP